MKLLYLGQYSDGTTSKMRADQIKSILNPESFDIIDTHIPFYNTPKLIRSFGFRFKKGPLVWNINRYIRKTIRKDHYDLIWVDKGIFLDIKNVKLLRAQATKMIHFTPDPAFTFHKSKLFNSSLPFYDYVITTKSFEIDYYLSRIDSSKLVLTTQGFDKEIHIKSNLDFSVKEGLVFIGHHEKEREQIIKKLLDKGVPVTLAGIKWDSLAQQYKNCSNLNYLGKGVYGKEYVKTIQQAKIAWGAVSKWIPELHTTRTFEIPACGTALLTERNKETVSFFQDNEAIFYNSEEEMIEKIMYYMNNSDELCELTQKGYEKVFHGGYDYQSILKTLLNKIME